MRKQEEPRVALIMGSDSDWPAVKPAADTLESFGVTCDVRVMSAHRTPEAVADYARHAARNGVRVIVAAAGGAAHLAGVLAAHTTLPVIGIPVQGRALNGLDSLLSTVQMPAGVPVAAVALGSSGPVNAALLAVQILALSRPRLAAALRRHRQRLKARVAAGERRVRATLKAAK